MVSLFVPISFISTASHFLSQNSQIYLPILHFLGSLAIPCFKDSSWCLQHLQSILSSSLSDSQISWCVRSKLTKESLLWSFPLPQVLFPLTLLVPLKLSQHSFIVKTDAEEILTLWPSKNIHCHFFSFSSEEQISSSLQFSLTINVLTESCLLFFLWLVSSTRSFDVLLIFLCYFFNIYTLNTLISFLYSVGFFLIMKSLKNSLFSQLGVSLIFLCLCFLGELLLVLLFLP